MFQERLEIIMDVLGLNNSRLASYCGFDRTNLTRFRNGSRVPARDSDVLAQLINGICAAAAEQGCTESLCTKLNYPEPSSEEVLRGWLTAYLTEGLAPIVPDTALSEQTPLVKTFGYRLDAVMHLLGISNARLSKLLDVDPSLISRYRSGSRAPNPNSPIVHQMDEILYKRLVSIDKQSDFCALSNIPEDTLTQETFHTWLFVVESRIDSVIEATNSMIQSLDKLFSESARISDAPLPPLDPEDNAQVYIGFAGLQKSLIRFLNLVIQNGGRDIWMYSDQALNWLYSTPSFWAQWNRLLHRCIEHNIRIHIIHQLNHRNLKDMIHSIVTWIPLNMTNMTDSYYCTRENASAFTHACFLCPGIAAVTSVHVQGSESTGIYSFLQGTEVLEYFEHGFRQFLNYTQPLITPYEEHAFPDEVIAIISDQGVCLKMSEDQSGPLPLFPMKTYLQNVKLTLTNDRVFATRISGEPLTLQITHPLLREAFFAFLDMLLHQDQT